MSTPRKIAAVIAAALSLSLSAAGAAHAGGEVTNPGNGGYSWSSGCGCEVPNPNNGGFGW